MLTQIYQCCHKFINVSTNTISMLMAKKTDVREEEKPMLTQLPKLMLVNFEYLC